MTDLDDLLERLARAPVPARLATMEAEMLARIAALPTGAAAGIGSGIGMLAIVIAAGLGVVGATVPAAPAHATPFGMTDALAPSTLLAGGA